MYRNKKYIAFIAVLLFMLTSVACATLEGQKAYLAALKKYTQTAQTYEKYYQAASDSQKAKWKEEIDPIFLEASAALDVWGLAVASGAESNEGELYENIFSKLWSLLIEAGVIEVKEE